MHKNVILKIYTPRFGPKSAQKFDYLFLVLKLSTPPKKFHEI